MLGTISPQTVKITSSVVTYPGRDHVNVLNVKRFNGRSYSAVDLSLLTRAVLVFPQTSPVIAYDTATAPAGTITWAGSDITIDLSDFSMPASVQSSYLIVYDAEHLGGQVLVDDDDAIVEFDFRNISAAGIIQPPVLELVSEAPADNVTYGRKNGTWVSIDEVVAGVTSVNGFTGTVVLDTDDVAEGVTNLYHTTARVQTVVDVHVADTTPHAIILGLDRVGFSLTPAGPAGVGEIVWNDTDKTLDLGLPDGVTLQAGQEVQVRGLNNSGTTMLNGQAVYISGASGNRLVFSRAQANQISADKTLAVLTQDIANNAQGQATVIGLVRDLDTSGFAEGAELWVSASVLGGLTQTKPPPPNNAVRVGFCVRSHASIGSIFVRVQNIELLSDLHDLNIINPLDGDSIEYDSATSTWINVPNTGGAGEVNTASNLGAGTGVFAQKVSADLQFKSLVAGSGITLTPTATEITITGSGGSGAVDSVNGQTGVVVLVTDDIAEDGAPVNLWFTNARAAAAAPVQTVDGQTGAVSLSASYAPLSHVGDTGTAHGNATTTVAGFMSGADKTKLDSVETGAQVNVATDIAQGTRTGTTVPVTSSTGADATLDAATTTLAGVMSAADKTKLDGIATGATANQTDAFLLARANHTGTQAISTVTGLQASLDSKTGLPAVATFTGNKTLALADINTYNVSQDGTAQTVNLPAQATVVWTADAEIHIEQGGAGAVTVTGATGVTVNGVLAGSFVMGGQYSAVTLKRTGSDAWTLIGSLESDVVTGPASSGDGNIALYNGTTGKVIKDGGTVTSAGLALLDDASASAQRTTLGVGTGDSPAFTALTLTDGQIVFPATQVPSAGANTLDDYEEGTWTPVLTFATPGNLSVTYVNQTGLYTKCGRQVSLLFTLVTSTFTHTTASGNLLFTGAPFTAATARGYGAQEWRGITKAGYTDLAARINVSATQLDFIASGSGVAMSNVVAADTPTGGTIDMRGFTTYFV